MERTKDATLSEIADHSISRLVTESFRVVRGNIADWFTGKTVIRINTGKTTEAAFLPRYAFRGFHAEYLMKQ